MSLFPPDVTGHKFRAKILQRPLAERTIGIIFTPRSGSSWLTEILTKDGRFGKPQEWFNPNFVPNISHRIGATDPEDYVDLLRRQHQSHKVFSFEATLYQIPKVFASERTFLDALGEAPIEWCYLTRKDIVLQAVSLTKAVTTGIFHAPQRSEDDRHAADRTFEYDAREIRHWLDHIVSLERRSERFFERHGIAPRRLSYEDIVEAGPAGLLEIFGGQLETAGVQPPPAPRPGPSGACLDTQHQKIGSQKNIDFAARFVEENRLAVAQIIAARRMPAGPVVHTGTRPVVYLHIGAHKTATTSLQYRAMTFSSDLRAQGVHYPASNRHQYGHHRLAFALKGQTDGLRGDVPDFDTEIAELKDSLRNADAPKALISAEGLLVLPKKKITALAQALSDFDLRVLVMVRQPDEYLLSHFNQMAKAPGNGFTLTPEAFFSNADNFPQELNFGKWIGNWADIVGQEALSLLRYENAEPTETVLSALGLPSNALPQAPRFNQSCTLRQLTLIRFAKRAGLPVSAQRIIASLAQRVVSGSRKPDLSEPERAAILHLHGDSLTALFDRFGQDNPYLPPAP